MKNTMLSISLFSLLLASCGGTEPEKESQEVIKTEETTAVEVPAIAEITIEGNDQMKYNLDRIDVYEGQTVRLTLKNVGVLSKEAMGHNWVLVKAGTDKEAFVAAAMNAKDQEYIPQDFKESIIAHTSLIGGGEETTITFEAPAKGFYPFFCSFPGHYAFMKGTFYVNAK
jgi:azurin